MEYSHALRGHKPVLIFFLVFIVLVLFPTVLLADVPKTWHATGAFGPFATEAEAAAAMRASSPNYAPLTTRTGPTSFSGSSQVRYDYSGPTIDMTLTEWTYSSPFGQFPDEASAIQSLVDAQPSDPQCSPTTASPQGFEVTFTFGPNYGPAAETSRYETEEVIITRNDYDGVNTQTCYSIDIRYRFIYRHRQYLCPTNFGSDTLTLSCHWSYTGITYGTPLISNCPKSSNANPGGDPGLEGNPCNVANGAKQQTETDYADSTLGFARYYHSLSLDPGSSIGVGWNHNFNDRLVLYPNKSGAYGWVRANGYHEPLTRLNTDQYISYDGGKQELLKTGAGWTLKRSGIIDQFNSDGLLVSRQALGGRTRTFQHDAEGRLTKIKDDHGRALGIHYDAGLISHITRPDGLTIHYSYDSRNNLVEVSYPDNTSKTYHYEDSRFPHALTGITDERGIRYATYAYNEDGIAILSEHAGGVERVTLDYTTTTTTVTDSLGAQRVYTMPSFGIRRITKLVEVCDGCNDDITTYYHDYTGALIRKTDNGLTTSFGSFNQLGNPGYKVEGFQRRTDYEYDLRFQEVVSEKREPSVINSSPAAACIEGSNCRVTQSNYDDQGNLLNQAISGFAPDGSPVSRTTSYQYNGPYGQPSQIDGPRTDVADITTLEYYLDDASEGPNRGRLKRVTGPTGIIERDNIQYNTLGKLTSEQRPNGVTVSYTYYSGNDRLETLTQSQSGVSQVTRWSYLPTGEVASITHADGEPEAIAVTFTYDDARRLTRITDGLGHYIEYTLDSEGNRLNETIHDANGQLSKSLSQTYDSLDRLTQRSQVNESQSMRYLANGLRSQATDGHGTVTGYSYDVLRRLTQMTEDLGHLNYQTHYSYDIADRLTQVTDAKGLTTTYAYDDLGNLVTETSPNTGATTYTYDEAGNRLSQTDARGVTVTFSYDALNRLTNVSYPDSSLNVTYSYDQGSNGTGRLSQMTDGSGTTDYAYDFRGNLITETRSQLGQTYTTEYAYDLADNLIAMTYPSGRSVHYTRNGAAQITQVSLSEGVASHTLANNIQYLPQGPVASLTLGNGLTQNYHYDQAYRQTGQTVSGIQDLANSYDSNGNITTITDSLAPANDQVFGYDSLDRLTTAQGNYGSLAYSYDPVGNRTSETENSNSTSYSYSPISQQLESLTGSITSSLSYDANGNQITQDSSSYTYSDLNRLAQASNNSQSTGYAYNGRGERTVKQGQTNTTLYHYDPSGLLLSETDEQGNSIRDYIYLNGQRLAILADTGTYYIHSNHLDTPHTITDQGQNIVWQATYTPFGEARISTASIENNLRFPGQYFDAETNLHYNYYRYYDPEIGRYITSDPIGLFGGINTYSYANQNSLKYIDPYGLTSCLVRLKACRATCGRQSGVFGASACIIRCEEKFGALSNCRDDDDEEEDQACSGSSSGDPRDPFDFG